MSYKTYTTEALVCGSVMHNTSDRSFLLFTREAGMLFASARSVREERSKQRYALQDFSHIRVTLLKGKSGWRIGSVEALGNPFLRAEDRRTRGTVNFVVSQLRRFVHGEEPLPRVFSDAIEVLLSREREEGVRSAYHDLFLLRLHAQLGYIAPEPRWEGVLEAQSIKEAYAAYAEDMKASITQALKKATEASHL